ncbi:MAG: LPS export ABC transporter ATP-binding protein [Elusimicrobia bacterium]|nr:LPS export ABC transporter ATP-binding protein [Elusimicrobiota bacterium]
MILEAKDLVHFYGKRKVLDNVSIRASSGEIVGLLGPNGAGKTTCFRIMAGLMRPGGGEVLVDSQPVTRRAIYQRARMGLGYLPQESSVFRSLTVTENILVALAAIKFPKNQAREKAAAIIDEYQLAHVAGQPSHTLSGGERRRLEIARAIAAEPKILMLDEPFTGIDPITVDELRMLLGRLKGRGIGIVLTDHNARETLKVIDRSYLIHSGKILTQGDAQSLLNDERARRLYLGWEMTL